MEICGEGAWAWIGNVAEILNFARVAGFHLRINFPAKFRQQDRSDSTLANWSLENIGIVN